MVAGGFAADPRTLRDLQRVNTVCNIVARGATAADAGSRALRRDTAEGGEDVAGVANVGPGSLFMGTALLIAGVAEV